MKKKSSFFYQHKITIWGSFLLLLLSMNFYAQEHKKEDDLKRIIVVKANKFKVYNNWISGGAGYAKHFSFREFQFTAAADYNFHIRKEYLQGGVMVAGEQFGFYNFYQLHLAYGKRRETRIYNLAYFAGISWSRSFIKADGVYQSGAVDLPGLYGNVQWIYKLTYDVGAGLSLFGNINPTQSIVGLRLDIYFSGAYIGKANPYMNTTDY